jgi:hypothetical protein
LRHLQAYSTFDLSTGEEAMGFIESIATKVCFGVLLVGSLVCAAQSALPPVDFTVQVVNRAGVPRDVLVHAESEATRIFRAAGIHLAWNDCMETHQCHHAPGPRELVLSIVPDGHTASDLVYGVAFLDPAGNGKYADVFFRRIESAVNVGESSVARLLGTVAAHELGHLLLGSHGHSFAGVMTPVWREKTLHDAGIGNLLFTRDQATTMKAKITASSDQLTTEFTLVHKLPFAP